MLKQALVLLAFLSFAPQDPGRTIVLPLDPLDPPKENPYCDFIVNKTVPTPGIETIVCPDDAPQGMMYVVSEACYMSFANLFQEEASIIYNDACKDWRDATFVWRDGMDTALLAFASCISNIPQGSNFAAEYQKCKNAYNRAANSHLKNFNESTDMITRKLNSDIESLEKTFKTTVAGTCCSLVPKNNRR